MLEFLKNLLVDKYELESEQADTFIVLIRSNNTLQQKMQDEGFDVVDCGRYEKSTLQDMLDRIASDSQEESEEQADQKEGLKTMIQSFSANHDNLDAESQKDMELKIKEKFRKLFPPQEMDLEKMQADLNEARKLLTQAEDDLQKNLKGAHSCLANQGVNPPSINL